MMESETSSKEIKASKTKHFKRRKTDFFNHHVDPIQPSIQFPMEKEQNNKLSFLYVIITCTEQIFKSSVYRKPTLAGEYINFYSHHPYNVKKGTVCSLQHRAKTISSDTNAYQEERDSLIDTLHRNNYPEKSGSPNRVEYLKTYRNLSPLCQRSDRKDLKDMQSISERYSGENY